KRAWPDSCPGTKRFALHGASLSASRLKSWTSVTLALPGMVAHKVMGLASASVHARPASADAPGGEAVPGALTTNAGGNATTVARRGAARGRKIAILVTGGAVASVRRERGCAREALEPALEGTGVLPEQLQSELGPSPQDVLGRARELLAGEVLDLAL